MTQAYPLQWPTGKPRSRQRGPSNFGTNHWRRKKRISLSRAIDELSAEIERLGARDPVISTNVALRMDGLPRSGLRKPDDPGVAVYFTLPDGQRNLVQRCIAVDLWDRVSCNIWAVRKSIDAMRGLDRWGGDDMVTAVFTGFTALPDHNCYWQALGYECEADAVSDPEFEARAKKILMQAHPDRGGDVITFRRAVHARQHLREIRQQKP